MKFFDQLFQGIQTAPSTERPPGEGVVWQPTAPAALPMEESVTDRPGGPSFVEPPSKDERGIPVTAEDWKGGEDTGVVTHLDAYRSGTLEQFGTPASHVLNSGAPAEVQTDRTVTGTGINKYSGLLLMAGLLVLGFMVIRRATS